MHTLLDFEEPIGEILTQIEKAKALGEEGDVDVTQTVEALEEKLKETQKEVFKNLSPWQKVQLSRHPDRPYTLAYIDAVTGGNFQE